MGDVRRKTRTDRGEKRKKRREEDRMRDPWLGNIFSLWIDGSM